MGEPLLRVTDLVTAFHTDEGVVRAVDGVSLAVDEGRTLGLVGESGCGKSITCFSILGLLPETGHVEGGRIEWRGRDLLKVSENEMRKLRGDEVTMIFQEPMSSLSPVHRVGWQIAEAVRAHRAVSRREASERAVAMLDKVGIPAPRERARAYPHELSGGMRQRVMIAMALACDPKLLVADEPTTALDVTIQAQILDLLRRLKDELGSSIVFVTHDLGVVAELCDEVAVMYAGKIVERAPTRELYAEPRHPYTRGLLASVPGFGDNAKKVRLPTIAGVVPDLRSLPRGCRFQDRCSDVVARCRDGEPPLVEDGARAVACFVATGSAGPIERPVQGTADA